MVNNIPADVLTAQGCNFVIAVSVTAKIARQFGANKPDTPTTSMRIPSSLRTLLRTLEVQNVSLNAIVQPAEVVIEPEVIDFDLSEFMRAKELCGRRTGRARADSENPTTAGPARSGAFSARPVRSPTVFKTVSALASAEQRGPSPMRAQPAAMRRRKSLPDELEEEKGNLGENPARELASVRVFLNIFLGITMTAITLWALAHCISRRCCRRGGALLLPRATGRQVF